MEESKELQAQIRQAALGLYQREGLKFTMQQLAEELHISKKTIYGWYDSKEALLLDLVDDAFLQIHARKRAVLDGSGTIPEKLRAVIVALPEAYSAMDLQRLGELEEKYPAVARRVRWQLETGWEPTLQLMEQAMEQGIMRRVSLPVLKRMISSAIEDFLSAEAREQLGLSYRETLDQMISILMEGVLVR